MFLDGRIAPGAWGTKSLFLYVKSSISRLRILCSAQPFSWSWGQYKPTVNEYSWTNLSSMLYIEQPVGTGYSQGVPNINNEEDLAAQFVGFLQQFLEVFSELKGKKAYLTGESVRPEFTYFESWMLITIWASLSMPGCTFHVSCASVLVRGCALNLRRRCRLYLQEEGTP